MSSPATRNHLSWFRIPGLRLLNFLLLSCYLGAISNGYISSLVSALLSNPRFSSTLHMSSVSLGLVTCAHSIGCIAAFLPSPWVSEAYGRRRAIQLGNMGMLAGFAGQVGSRTYGGFLACRILVGFSSMFSTISSAALLTELALPRHRSVAGALFNTCWFVGSISCAWTSFFCLGIRAGDWSWKIPVAAQASWVLAQFVFVLFCPESPTWLVRHDRLDLARRILVRFHANGNAEDEAVRDEFTHLVASSQDQRGTSSNWSALYATPGRRQRLLLSIVIGISTQCVGNSIVSFYLAPILSTIGISSPLTQQSINGSLQIYTFLIAICSALLSNVFGRRRLFLTSTSTMLLFMVLVTICSALYSTTRHAAAGYAVIVFLFLFFGGYVIGLTPIPILYVNEIWPDHLRTKGTSVFWVTQALAVCFNQFLNPIALERIAWRYYIVYVGVLVAVITFMFFCVPETKDLTLEEIGNMFDRKEGGDVELVGDMEQRNESAARV